MKRLWSPWRMKYVGSDHKCKDCVFCDAICKKDDPETLILFTGNLAFVILNAYPYNTGHALVMPFSHVPTYEGLDRETRSEIIELINHTTSTLRSVYHPDGFNVGANIGSSGGAGVADHVHFHIVPRWNGDTNFMTTVAETRVIPEELSTTLQRLKKSW